ncbi:UNVERIFIED_ORG: trans-aconitate 2-methyltransferase [Shinella sp. XGS7]|nr:trans-aconitate 2-methyltransferase [Shinella sp. XGS7]
MTQDWNPALYRRYEDERTRPAAELLARVDLETPQRVIDLGCGPGNSTELLARRYPAAQIIGLDHSPAMLEAARERLPGLAFLQADLAQWSSPEPVDLLFANAVLQWLPGHQALLPHLLAQLAPGGVLALQMPDNLEEASHRLMRETAALPPYVAHIGPAAARRERLLGAEAYYDLLAPEAEVDLWRTHYYHRMDDAAAIVDWVRATGLRPFLDALPDASLRAQFLADYQARLETAYPARRDGSRLLGFPRLFIVARRRG